MPTQPQRSRQALAALCIISALLCLATCAQTARAAQGPAMMDKPQLVSFTATPLYDDAGALLSLAVTAKFKVMMLLPDGKAKQAHLRSVEFDLVRQSGQSVVIGNELVEFGDVAADIVGIAEFAWKMNHPDPLPVNKPVVRRKAIKP